MNGLLAHCRREGLLDKGFLDGRVAVPEGFLEGIDIGHDLESVADTCDLPPADLPRLFDLFDATPLTVTLFRDRKSVLTGKSVSVRVDLGGSRNLKTKKTKTL